MKIKEEIKALKALFKKQSDEIKHLSNEIDSIRSELKWMVDADIALQKIIDSRIHEVNIKIDQLKNKFVLRRDLKEDAFVERFLKELL
jgi:hypothetical protein